MFRNVGISDSIPRELSTFNASMTEGLLSMRFFGYFFLLAGLILFLITAFKFKLVGPSIFILLIAAAGFYFVQKSSKTVKERKDIFTNGEVVRAEVIEHGRSFSIFKSKQDYTILIKVKATNEKIEIKHAKEDLWRSSPIGDEILGLTHNNKYFFGEQIGVQFSLFK